MNGVVHIKINSYSMTSLVSNHMYTFLVHNQPLRPTQPPTLCGIGNEYQPRKGKEGRKGRVFI